MQSVADTLKSSIPGTYWQWQGHSLYYVRAGERQGKKPPLLLIHGFGASTDHWGKNIAELQQEFEIYAIDLVGFGRSAKPNIYYTANLWREQIQAFIQEVIKTPVVLAGNSLGGYISLCVAAAYPELTAGLVLLNSAGQFTETSSNLATNPLQQGINNLVRWVVLQPWANYLLFQYVRQPSTIRKTLEKVYLDQTAVTDQLVEDIYRPSCDLGAAQVFASVFKNPHGEKVDVLLSQINCPLLNIWGEADPWMNSKIRGNKFRQYYPNLEEHYLKAGHCPHDEVPSQVNGLIRDWFVSKVVV
jgi:pimeloyl-ACP methyl ester carboxylesterase